MPLPLDNQLCFALYATSMAINRTYKPMLDEMGITYPQYLVLNALGEVVDDARKIFRARAKLPRRPCSGMSRAGTCRRKPGAPLRHPARTLALRCAFRHRDARTSERLAARLVPSTVDG